MGHHLIPDGKFQSDKYPSLPPDVVGVKISLKTASALWRLVAAYRDDDQDFAHDLAQRLLALGPQQGGEI